MAEDSELSIRIFQQMRNRQNDLYRKNTEEIRKAGKAKDRKRFNELRKARGEMRKVDMMIMDAEAAFIQSTQAQSDAEDALLKHTREANKLVKSVKTAGQMLQSVAKLAGILERLLKALA